MFSRTKRPLVVAAMAGVVAIALTACSSDPSDNSSNAPARDVTLEMATTWTGERLDGLKAILAEFTSESGVKVDLLTPGDQYETVMKTRMGSQDLPDIWETHGWAVARYSEYLSPLNDQPWVDRIDDAILPIISDADGNIFGLPLTQGINTISYSKDALDAADIKAEDIRTWDDFAAAAEKLRAAGITPIFIGNKSGDIAQLAEAIPPTYLTNSDAPNPQSKSLKDGTFDFGAHWTPISEQVRGWYDNEFFNVDILTADNESGTKALGAGTAAFMFGGSNNIKSALTFYPDANLGLLPVPAATASGASSLSMGEGSVYGMWKDTKYPTEVQQLMAYLAKAETVGTIAQLSGDLPGFADAPQADDKVTQYFRTAQAQFADDIEYVPLFDREYLPSGMWDDLTISLTQIITDGDAAITNSVKTLADAYSQKYVE